MNYIGGVSLVAALVCSSAVHAAPFGPATASLGSYDVPTVTIGATTGTVTLNGGAAQLNAGTGSLSSTPYQGSGSGTLNFSLTPGMMTSNLIANLFSFDDHFGGNYTFNLQTVGTVSYSNAPGVSTSIALYLLGTMQDTHLGLDPTMTSLTMTFNRTGTSNYSESGSLSNPPTPMMVPEPASIALLGLGLAGAGLIGRRFKG